MRQTRGSETSQYPEEEKSKEIPLVAASEWGRAQTDPNTKSKSSIVQKLKDFQQRLLNFCTFALLRLVLGLGL